MVSLFRIRRRCSRALILAFALLAIASVPAQADTLVQGEQFDAFGTYSRMVQANMYASGGADLVLAWTGGPTLNFTMGPLGSPVSPKVSVTVAASNCNGSPIM